MSRNPNSWKLPPMAIHGGEPVRSKPWPTYEKGDPWLGEAEEKAVVRAIRSRRLFRYDDRSHSETEVGKLESALQDYFGKQHALAVTSGTAALALSLIAAGIGPGDRVACPAFTFAATPSAILMAGAVPVLLPVDQDLHIRMDEFESVLSSIDAAIIVHMRGAAEDIESLTSVAASAGVLIFEDAVPAMGLKVGDRYVGTFGLAGSFSMQSDKSINTGEGGFILTDDKDFAARATVLCGAYEGRVLRHFDDVHVEELLYPLYSMRLDELRGALGRAQLESLPNRVDRSIRNYNEILGQVCDISGMRPRRSTSGADIGNALILFIDDADAGSIARALTAEGIDSRALCGKNPANIRSFWNWRFLEKAGVDLSSGRLEESSRLIRSVVDIPLSASMIAEDRQDLVVALRRVAEGFGLS